MSRPPSPLSSPVPAAPAAGPRARPELADLPPAIHGGAESPSVLDFSTGVSPLPTPPAILDAARAADLRRYPHPTARPLRQSLSALHDLPPDQIVAGAGSAELIWALARACGGPGRSGVVLAPAFGEYERALRASGARVQLVRADAPPFAWNAPAVAAAVTAVDAALVFLCRPSNPCLHAWPHELVAEVGARCPRTLLVVDEAYLPLFEGVDPIPPSGNVAVLRSLTKVFALPGLRVGYLLAPPAIAAAVQASLPPWNVSAPAQAAGAIAAHLLPAEGPRARAAVGALRRSLVAGLDTLGLAPVAQGGPFVLYRDRHAGELCAALAARGAQLRHLASFGLPDHIRVGVQSADAQERLAAIWRDVAAARA